MRVNKVISVLVVSGLLMPLQLPPYFISEALADGPVTVASDPSSMTSDTAVSGDSFVAMVESSKRAIEDVRTLADMEGPVAPATAVDPPAEEAEDLDLDPDDIPIEVPLSEEDIPAEEECPPDSDGLFPLVPEPDDELNPLPPLPADFASAMPAAATAPVIAPTLAPPPVVPIGTGNAAALAAAQAAMNGAVDDFVSAEWTGIFGAPKRPFVKSQIKSELNTLIGMVITTGGTIGFSTVAVPTGKNLIVTINYPGGIIFTITVSVSPTAGSSPSAADVSKTFTSNISTVFTNAMISLFQTIVQVLIGAMSDPIMPPTP